MAMEIVTYELPTSWACALVNGDETGFEEDESRAYNCFVSWMLKTYDQCFCLEVEDSDTDFRAIHDASDFGVLATNVSTFSFDVTKHRRNKTA